MEKTPENKTLGQAIDEVIAALQPLDSTMRMTAIRAACEHLKITLVDKPDNVQLTGHEVRQPSQEPTSPAPQFTDIRSLKEQKQPQTASEMSALIAYYLSEVIKVDERKDTVNVDDMEKYFKQASYPLPKSKPLILHNAKKAGYFDSVGEGRFKLNPVGYNLVVHNLPSSSGEGRSRVKKNASQKRSVVKGGSQRKSKKSSKKA